MIVTYLTISVVMEFAMVIVVWGLGLDKIKRYVDASVTRAIVGYFIFHTAMSLLGVI